MANNYDQATVTPCLPKGCLLEEEIEVLEECGFTVYRDERPEAEEEYYYLYIEESFWDEENAVPTIFQKVLNRLPMDKYPVIIIEGASTCSKMRQGEFGGWAGVITRKTDEWIGTADWVSRKVKEEEERIKREKNDG